jgi:hypothetical protein
MGTASAIMKTPQSGMINVTPSSTLQNGHFSFDVLFRGITVEGEALPQARLPVTGVCTRNFSSTPEVIINGPAPIGTSVVATLVVSSLDGRSFSLGKSERTDTTLDYKSNTNARSDNRIEVIVSSQIERVGEERKVLLLRFYTIGGQLLDEMQIPVLNIGLPSNKAKSS